MNRTARLLLAGLALGGGLAAAAPAPVAAQSDILLRLRSGSPLGDRARVDSAGGFVALGTLGYGIIPASGNSGGGVRMMWLPYHGAFRAGAPGGAGATTWDFGNMGFYSWAGGYNALASGYASFAFGDGPIATGSNAIALGYRTSAEGNGSIGIGYRSTASADFSVALGQRAATNGFSGAIVIADGSTTDSLEATANNQFSLRAAGGIRLFTHHMESSGMTMNAGGSGWNAVSDRNRKEDFESFGGEDLLETLRAVPVTKWRYRDEVDRSVWHVGPMAQDWHAAFGLGGDNLTINTVDIDGVNLAAIRALEERTSKLMEENAALRSRMNAAESENAELRGRLERIEALLQAQKTGS